MNPEIAQIIKDQLASLPEAVRKAMAETDVTAEIVALKDKYHLMLDQVTSIELDTRLTMIGIEDGNNFVENIKKHAHLTNDVAVSVAEDVEDSIFAKIRSAIMAETEDVEIKPEESLDKDSILAEIENPTPTFQPKNTQQTAQNLPTIQASHALEEYTPPHLPAKTIVDQKISGPTRIPPKEIEVSLSKLPQNPPITQKYTTDPYKEPIA